MVTVAFRADASIRIGTGHVMRCLTLARVLREQGAECTFITRQHQGHLVEMLESEGFPVIRLLAKRNGEAAEENSADYTSWLGGSPEEDARDCLAAIEGKQLDWLVVDHYALDAGWETRLKPHVGQIMVIDDLANRPHDCALLLDQNLGRSAADYDHLVPDDCVRLIGPKYALLRPEFAELRESSLARRKHPELKRILISLGGVDRTNITGQVLDALSKTTLPADIHLDIVMGSAAPFLDEVRQQVDQLPYRATVNVDVNDMAARMHLADLSIGAAGGTSWERCCLGLPVVLLVLADNQITGAKALEATGAAIVISHADAIQAAMSLLLAKAGPRNCLQQMSNAAAAITNGEGTPGAAEFLMTLAGRPH